MDGILGGLTKRTGLLFPKFRMRFVSPYKIKSITLAEFLSNCLFLVRLYAVPLRVVIDQSRNKVIHVYRSSCLYSAANTWVGSASVSVPSTLTPQVQHLYPLTAAKILGQDHSDVYLQEVPVDHAFNSKE
jgi:hypothetical protein